ncbi:PHO88 family protein KNAG_0H00680 [Huiozyma naganishii CBS 8797]|uniref:Inorganic phosphate transport protein PHO88 n=1 Tax=Huiozyma naganishii (strain ATCC MYA-139 / BCRC 22969 / CBS 8797 / KCTC 17520 / NBRC 10181 / NCYC 3082 / Yp74L-3) TaxID=1071383 RepID=J7S8E6_HUIN7|nr:hypothetical protein KNAG_0H00680 [Kazachstania naganishii CBS 8797]CCK71484.1 hypothetical protein KNAG_0H00680 [Kazachstania naganishii CBS 8797]
MNPQVTNIAIMLVMMGASRFIDMENKTVILYIRVLYCSCAAVTWLLYQLTAARINRANDLSLLKYAEPPQNALLAATSLAEDTSRPRLKVTTVHDYDMESIQAALKSLYQSLAFMLFLHLYLKYNNPLFMQAIGPVKGALENNVVKIHLFGKPATGNLRRPFRAESLLSKFSGGSDEVKTDKKTIEALEMAGEGGAIRKLD